MKALTSVKRRLGRLMGGPGERVTSVKRWLAVAATVAVLIVAGIELFGGGSASGGGKTQHPLAAQPSPGFSPPAHGVACAGSVCYVNGSPVPQSSAKATPKADHSPYATPKIPDFVQVDVPQDRSWGCAVKQGQTCYVPFEGFVFLESADRGTILIQAYEDNNKTPAASRTLSPAVKGKNVLCTSATCPYAGSLLKYTIGAKARHVTFVVTLIGDNGRKIVSGSVGGMLLPPP